MNPQDDDDEPNPPTGWQWLGGCFIGALLGAIGAPLAFLLFIGLMADCAFNFCFVARQSQTKKSRLTFI